MPSCDASDVQLKAQSPLYRRAREMRKDAGKESYCEAKEKNLEPCPPGFCRCSGELRRKIATVDHPWGSPHQDLPPHRPPAWSKVELDAALVRANEARAAMRGAVLPALGSLVDAMAAHRPALPEDERERLAELEEWRDALGRE